MGEGNEVEVGREKGRGRGGGVGKDDIDANASVGEARGGLGAGETARRLKAWA